MPVNLLLVKMGRQKAVLNFFKGEYLYIILKKNLKNLLKKNIGETINLLDISKENWDLEKLHSVIGVDDLTLK